MRTTVTAILVARHRSDMLEQTIAAIAAQTRTPDRIVAVTTDADHGLANDLRTRGFSAVLAAGGKVSFGQAAKLAAQTSQPEPEQREWLWLLTEDAAPDPDALEQMLLRVQSAPSVAVAGPKIVRWDEPGRIIELGQGLTWSGARWVLDRQELDQQQYDHLEDTLGVGPVGMLVRRDAWEELHGFDPALPVYDDGLDFSVRARLAGYRVVVVPGARVRFGQGGVAGPQIDRRRSVLRTARRHARAAELHRRLVYAPAVCAPIIWLALPLIGVLGMIWALIRERPDTMLGELRAALGVFFRPGRILRARRNIRRTMTVGWSAVRPLRTDRKTVRTVRMISREAILVSQGRQVRELHFISTGGPAITAAAALLSIVLTWWALGSSFATGGGMAPLSNIGTLWTNTISEAAVSLSSWVPFRDAIPADAFAWVLALTGSLTFWNPSLATMLVLVAAVPVATLGGWMWGASLSEGTAPRILAGLAWGIAPMLLGAIDTGRLSSVILAMVLPWLFVAASRAHQSWSWAGTASLLAAVALACAPVLLPAGIIALVAGMLSHPSRIGRMVTIALAPLAIMAPKIVHAIAVGRPLDALVDPGVAQGYAPGTPWHMLLGFPTFGLEGWGAVLEGVGIDGLPATLLAGFLLIPLGALTVIGLFTGTPRTTMIAALVGAAGLVTGLLSAHVRLMPVGSEMIPIWSGSGLALYWLAMITLAVTGAAAIKRAATPVVTVAVIGLAVICAPAFVHLATADVEVRPGYAELPAVAEAAAQTDPASRTLTVEPLADGDVRAVLVEGSGTTLDSIRTAERLAPISELEQRTAATLGGLVSAGGVDLREQLAADGIRFVLVSTSDAATADGQGRARLQAAFDQNPSLEAVGQTERGMLWRVLAPDAPSSGSDEVPPTDGGNITWTLQLIVLGAVILLALPTGELRERPAARARRNRRNATAQTAHMGQTPQRVPVAAQRPTDPAAPAPHENLAEAPPGAYPNDDDDLDDATLYVDRGARPDDHHEERR